jgi:IS5 family transposase
MPATLSEAGCTVTEMAGQAAQADAVGPVETVSEVGVERVVADKGYHSKQALQNLAEVGVRTVIAEPERKRQKWAGQSAAQAAVYANRRRMDTQTAKALMKRRGELIERAGGAEAEIAVPGVATLMTRTARFVSSDKGLEDSARKVG